MNKLIHIKEIIQYAITVLSAIATGCQARDIPIDWKADCTGTVQLSFPGKIEQAVTPRVVFQKELSSWHEPLRSGYIAPYQFSDGEAAGWSDLAFGGALNISEPLSQLDQKEFKEEVNRWGERRRSFILKTQPKNKTDSLLQFKKLSKPESTYAAWRVDESYIAYFEVGNRGLFWRVTGRSDSDTPRDYESLASGLQVRQTFEVPIQSGICLPYAFIRDGSNTRRYIATTYRLQDHPDITVLLKDVTAAGVDPKANPAVYDPESISNSFWSRYDSSYRKSLRSVWNTPYKNASLANSKGVESFVKIVRNDDAVDYGYLVATRGDPDAKEDTPDLMLYVIQDSKNAKAKGITPMEKDAFLEMAQTIAASVKRRPVTAQ
jgi:hypothetical protein